MQILKGTFINAITHFWPFFGGTPPDHPKSPFEITYPPPRKVTSFMNSPKEIIAEFKTAPAQFFLSIW